MKNFSETLYPGSIVPKGSRLVIVNIFNLCHKAAIDLKMEEQGHKAIGFKRFTHRYTHTKF